MADEHGLAIRRAEADDAETLAQLAAKAFRDAYQASADPVELEAHIACHFNAPAIAAELADPGAVTFLLEQHGRLAGYALLRSGTAPECVRGPAPIELGRIYLEVESLGKGLGAVLMRACLDEAARMGRETLWLGVWQENHRALAFYRRWGFREAGRYAFDFGGTLYQDIAMTRPVPDAG
jgi:diamine N-acetyltransferase